MDVIMRSTRVNIVSITSDILQEFETQLQTYFEDDDCTSIKEIYNTAISNIGLLFILKLIDYDEFKNIAEDITEKYYMYEHSLNDSKEHTDIVK